MTQELLELYGDFIESMTLVPSDGGVFEVSLDDKLIFSKKKEGRFPTHDEILKVVKART